MKARLDARGTSKLWGTEAERAFWTTA